ncbi:unnamed protein product [Scytosiphon promiscuus]
MSGRQAAAAGTEPLQLKAASFDSSSDGDDGRVVAHYKGAESTADASTPAPLATGTVMQEAEYPSEAARRWAKLRQHFRLAALRSIAQDKREALKKLQEVRKRADKAQAAQSDSRTCKICWDRATNTVCLDCGHQCMCTRCGACMTFCPICMQDINDLVELQ